MARLPLLERIARQRRGLIVLVVAAAGLLACSHPQPLVGAPGEGVTVTEDPTPERQVGPEGKIPLPGEDRCGGYAVAMAPILGRVARATDTVAAGMEAATTREAWRAALAGGATALGQEEPALAAISTGVAEIDAAHARLRRALAGLGAAFAGLAAAPDQASGQLAAAALKTALNEWDGAMAALRAACPKVE
jgi:hypothetical protein